MLPKRKHVFLIAPKSLTSNSSSRTSPTNSLLYAENNKLKIPHCAIFFNQPLFHLSTFQRRGTHLTTTGKTVQELIHLSLGSDEGTYDDRGRDGGTNIILRIKEQETRLTLPEHDDDDPWGR